MPSDCFAGISPTPRSFFVYIGKSGAGCERADDEKSQLFAPLMRRRILNIL